ncbi:MAG TPA: hypothetical protein ENH44_03315 [Actinobacteria bacterium]|nr:hypothetical protein [Actinomycetota bacterium]
MTSNNESISQRLLLLGGAEKRISCKQARNLAEEMKVSYADIGRDCNNLGIKIFACELGCF